MERLWWQLPGPARFVAQVGDSLREGKSVVLCLPQFPRIGVQRALRNALDEEDGWFWDRIDLADHPDLKPARLLFSLFAPDSTPGQIMNAAALTREDRLFGKALWIDGMTADRWPAWREFLQDWAHASRTVAVNRRCVMVVPVAGELALAPPTEDINLANHVWQSVVSEIDMLIVTNHLLQKARLSSLHRRVAASVIANVALWDPEVAQRLAAEPFERILSPLDPLREIAAERGWTALSRVAEKAWSLGMVDALAGQEVAVHSAVLAVTGDAAEISRRVWIGEVGIVLPYVEQMRRELLHRLAPVLKVPHQTPYGGVVEKLEDLEIGHIEYQIRGDPRVNSRIRTAVARLKEIRNVLSHLQCLDPAMLCDDLTRAFEDGRALAG